MFRYVVGSGLAVLVLFQATSVSADQWFDASFRSANQTAGNYAPYPKLYPEPGHVRIHRALPQRSYTSPYALPDGSPYAAPDESAPNDQSAVVDNPQ